MFLLFLLQKVNCGYSFNSTTVDSRYLKSKELSEILQDICTSTYQICRFDEKINWTTTFHKWYVIWLLRLEIYWKYCGKEEKLLFRSNFSSFPPYFYTSCFHVLTGTRFPLWDMVIRDKRSWDNKSWLYMTILMSNYNICFGAKMTNI